MNCSACGHTLKNTHAKSEKGRNVAAPFMLISLVGKHSEATRTRRRYGKGPFNICFCCALKAFGVPEVKR